MNKINVPHIQVDRQICPQGTFQLTTHDIPIEELTLNQLFERSVDLNPLSTAIITDDNALSYGELESYANQMAHLLQGLGVGPGSLVAIYFNRGIMPIISILGILKAGAAYVPLDPSYPQERISYILDSTNAYHLLAESSLLANISINHQKMMTIFDSYSLLQEHSTARITNRENGLSSSDLCYTLFTSGTTGRPKGIMTEHRNVVRFSHTFNQLCQISTSDRIYQGFALVFDGSVEEIWMAFGSGATLVIGRQELSTLCDEAAAFMNQHRVTVFSTVPTFLGMIKQELLDNRLIILSGEPCPPMLVDRWGSSQRRVLNVYGPTETTVNATVKECLPGAPVTIGTPLDGYQVYVLDEQFGPVEEGVAGELYIGGVGVARGYFDDPKLNQSRYILNPFSSLCDDRLFKTGDQVKKLDGELHFLGRKDDQVKIRGFRIELSEIDSLLQEFDQIRSAVTKIDISQGQKRIAAYAILDYGVGVLDELRLIEFLQQRLPPYMIPNYLDILEKLPTLPSGKVDRHSLPKAINPLIAHTREMTSPRNIFEADLLYSWQHTFKHQNISIDDDFFLNLRGDSLLVVEMLSHLRATYDHQLSVRDVYGNTTIEQLAKKVKEKKYSSEQIKDSSANRFAALPRWERYLSGFMQFLAVLFFYAVAPAPLVLLLYLGVASWQASFASSTLWIAIVALTILGYPLGLLASIALKWIIIGRYRPGSYPLWGWYYFRCWLTFRIQAASGVTLLTGTPIINLYYRLLGMRVGENTILDSAQFGAVDLITIGEDTAIGAGTQLHGFRIESGQMILAPVTVGRGCYIGNHSQLGLNSTMENGAVLDDLSTLPDNFTAKEGVSYRGSPPVGTEVDLTCYQNQSKNKRRPLLMATAHYLMLLWVGILFLLIAIPPLLTLIAAYLSYGINGLVSTSFIWAILGTPYFCLMVAGVKGLTMGRTTPGIYNTHGLYYLKRWSVDLFLTISSQLLHALYTTIYLPSWLRLLGAKIGKRTEISTVMKMTPDLVEIDDESFFADGSMIGGRRFYYGKVHYAKNQIGRRTFIGNNAMLPVGESIGANCLLGVLSLPPRNFPDSGDGSEWLGSPSFRLPHRNQVTIFSDETIYRPTLKLYTQRLLIDGLRILVPSLIALVSTLTYMFFLYYAFYNLTLIQTLATAPLVSIGLALTSALAVVFLKWIIMGVFRPVKKPLWSIYVWCNELINGVYETVGAPLIAPLMGTPFYNWYLRMLGCKIGKHTYIGTSLFSEFDLVNIGDYCALNSGVVVQNHLFEDRVMKSSHLHIGNNCTIGNMSVVLYDSVIRDNSTIAPLSLVMKGDDLPAHSSWEGIPIART